MYTSYLYNIWFVYRKTFQMDVKTQKFLKKAFKTYTNKLNEE
jgi:hypothetical protein